MKKTYYHLGLDKSGSMDSCWEEARQVINNQLKELTRVQSENPESQILFSVCAFNQALRFSNEITDIQQAQIHWETIYPEGMTAMYDAIGDSIGFVKAKAGRELELVDTEVVMLILTDAMNMPSGSIVAKPSGK